MSVLGMNLVNTLSPITKVNFKKWHSEGVLEFIGVGNGVLDVTLSRLNDMSVDWRSLGKQVTRYNISKNQKVYMFSNGCDEFILVIDDMQGSDYSKDYFNKENKQHIIVYVVKD